MKDLEQQISAQIEQYASLADHEWGGKALDGHSLLVYCFANYNLDIAHGGYIYALQEKYDVTIHVADNGVKFDKFEPIDRDKRYDYHIHLSKLPKHINFEALPLSYDKNSRMQFFPYQDLGTRVGIAWDDPSYSGDDWPITLEHFEALLKLPKACFFTLHHSQHSKAYYPLRSKFNIANLSQFISEDNNEFVQRINKLDVVITCNERIASTAIAMGKICHYVCYKTATAFSTYQSHFKHLTIYAVNDEAELDKTIKSIIKKVKPKLKIKTNKKYSKIVHERHATRIVEAKHGIFCTNKHDVFVGNSLFRYGEYSEDEVKLYQSILRPHAIVIEAGANIGALTVPLANILDQTGRIYAFEPQHHVFEMLCANLEMNGIINVWPFKKMVGDNNEPGVLIDIDPYTPRNAGAFQPLKHKQISQEQIPQIKLDDLNLPHCALIKIDVEGMEINVLKGAEQLIRKFKPFIYYELDREEYMAELEEYIHSLGYEIRYHNIPLFRPDNHNKNKVNIFGDMCSKNCIAIPKKS